jgi:hypothetical protein
VFEHTTQFLREGIKVDTLTKDQIEQLEGDATGQLPGKSIIFAHRDLVRQGDGIESAGTDDER